MTRGRARSSLLVDSTLVGVLLVWEGAVTWLQVPAFILPPPSAVLRKAASDLASGVILPHLWQTLEEILIGFAAAAVTGTGLEPKWPGDEVVHLRVGLAEGEDERETRQESYSVVLRGVVYDAPRDLPLDGLSEAAWRAYVPGSEHVVLFDHGEIVAIDPAP